MVCGWFAALVLADAHRGFVATEYLKDGRTRLRNPSNDEGLIIQRNNPLASIVCSAGLWELGSINWGKVELLKKGDWEKKREEVTAAFSGRATCA